MTCGTQGGRRSSCPDGLPGGVADDVYGPQDGAATIALAEVVVNFVSETLEASEAEEGH